MKRISLALAGAAFAFFFSGAQVLADDSAAGGNLQKKTAVVVDEDGGTVRILIDGKEIVVIDETGLYVRGDVAYEGTITDGLPPRLSEDGHAE